MATTHPAANIANVQLRRPYPPSWIDGMFAAMDRLPIPVWSFYLIFWLAEILLVNGVRWLDGSLPFGSFNATATFNTFYGVFILALAQYLKRVAGNALDIFRPALGEHNRDFDLYCYEMTTLPARATLVATALGALLVPPAIYLDPIAQKNLGASPIIFGVTLFTGYLGVLVGPIVLYNILRQLRLVIYLHQIATNIDLFQPVPLYAFSALSARAGLGFVVVAYYSILTDPTTFTNPLWYGGLFLTGLLAVAFFIVPLYNMHHRIVLEKQRLLADAGRHMHSSISELHQGIDENQLSNADALSKTFTSLNIERDYLDKMTTWPWQPETIRGFITALLLPVFLWLITRVLEKLISF